MQITRFEDFTFSNSRARNREFYIPPKIEDGEMVSCRHKPTYGMHNFGGFGLEKP